MVFAVDVSERNYPDLKLDPFVVLIDSFDLKVDAHRTDKGRCESIISIAEKEGCFSNAAVPNDQQLEHVIKVLIRVLLLCVVLRSSHL